MQKLKRLKPIKVKNTTLAEFYEVTPKTISNYKKGEIPKQRLFKAMKEHWNRIQINEEYLEIHTSRKQIAEYYGVGVDNVSTYKHSESEGKRRLHQAMKEYYAKNNQ